MMFHACQRDQEVTQLLRNGHWPEVCEEELRAHVNACQRCGDRARLAQAFHIARGQSERVAPSIPPGLLWWRAQLRRRNAAIEQMSKPLAVAQGFALAINFVVALAFCVARGRQAAGWAAWFRGLPQSSFFHVQALWPSWSWAAFNSRSSLLLLIASLGLLAVFSGVVVYLATEKL